VPRRAGRWAPAVDRRRGTVIEHLILIALLALLVATAFTVVRLRSLFATAMLTGIYSFLGAGWMLLLDAPDVAFTEAAVGAGISTVIFLATLSLTTREERPTPFRPLPLIVVLATGAALFYSTLDMPFYGDPEAPGHNHVAPEYIADRVPTVSGEVVEVGIENVVTTVLASYRGYDTLGETSVIFTAGIAVLLLLRRKP
jgi:multicomponent Na+:H+ antiporter subunit B